MGLNHGLGMQQKQSLGASKDEIRQLRTIRGDASKKLTWINVMWLRGGHQVFGQALLALLFWEECDLNM